jgi:hypothetical protein
MPDEGVLTPKALLSIPQHTRVSEPQYIISLFRQFLREQENIHRSTALELILLLILQQIRRPQASSPPIVPATRWRGKRSKSFVPGFICPFPHPRWRKSCTATPIIWDAFIVMFFG